MPRVAKRHESRVPMMEQKMARLLDRLDKMGDLLQTARDRMDLAEQVVEQLRQRVTVIESKLP